MICLTSFSCNNSKQTGSAEADKKAITELMTSYADALSRSDWPGLISKIHPQAFEYVSKRGMEDELKASLKGDNYLMHFTEMNIDSIYQVIAKGSAKYSFVRLNMTARMIFTDTLDGSYTKEALDKMCEAMRKGFEKDLLGCLHLHNGIEFASRAYCYVVYIPDEKKWFCITKDSDSERIVNKIIPAEIRKEFGF